MWRCGDGVWAMRTLPAFFYKCIRKGILYFKKSLGGKNAIKKKKNKTRKNPQQPNERVSHLLLFLIAPSPLPIFYLWVPHS